ncbi:hypothetical protein B2J93_7821 [Marssonina coronariae]|uniref:Uncharacterized protein n=1 Tax=Diplocarpon coronariae TaxID=2795749 RepID=A0A218ZBS0_9HELO|nr:hypothetical protein B2J93_7821 [Marssonina coronariae]
MDRAAGKFSLGSKTLFRMDSQQPTGLGDRILGIVRRAGDDVVNSPCASRIVQMSHGQRDQDRKYC